MNINDEAIEFYYNSNDPLATREMLSLNDEMLLYFYTQNTGDGGDGISPEQSERLSRIGVPLRLTEDYTILPEIGGVEISGFDLDVFPSADGKVITLPDPALCVKGYFAINIHNQTNEPYKIIVKDHTGAVVGNSINPTSSYKFFFDSFAIPEVLPWEKMELQGNAIPVLSPVTFGDFNSINWNNIASGTYIMQGTGSQFFNYSTNYTLLPVSVYIFSINVINEPSEFRLSILFTTTSDFTNVSLGRPSTRSGSDFGSSVTTGWKTVAMIEDLPVYFTATSFDSILISEDPNATTFFTGMTAYGNINGFTIDAPTGSVINTSGKTINNTTGTISIQPVKSGGSPHVMRLWSEYSSDGLSWTKNSQSLRTFEIASDGETFKTSVSLYGDWLNGQYLRFKCYSVGGGTLSLSPTADTIESQAITGPSVIWNLKQD